MPANLGKCRILPYRAGATNGEAAHQHPNFFLMLPMPPGNMTVLAGGYSAGDGLSGGGLGEGEA